MDKEQRKKCVQQAVLIVWEEGVSESKRAEIISNFYKTHENEIKAMETFEMKKGTDIVEEWKDFKKACNSE